MYGLLQPLVSGTPVEALLMSTTTYFCGDLKTNITRISPIIWSYVEYQEKKKKKHLGLAKVCLTSGVVLCLSGLNSGVVLYLSGLNSGVVLFSCGLKSGVVLFSSGLKSGGLIFEWS